MNNIYINNEIKANIDENIKVIDNKNIIIDLENTNATIEIENINKNIIFNITGNTNLIIKKLNEINIEETYNIHGNLNLIKINDCIKINEITNIHLNENSNIEYILKTISKNGENYITKIYHDENNTKCILYNHGVNIENGTLKFDVNNIVHDNIENTFISQNSKIITLNKNKCEIDPKLLIDTCDVEASHSALIENVKEIEKFYLMSRGISEKQSENLLIRSFLNSKINIDFDNILDKYWR